MKTKDFIAMLQKEDPSGEGFVRIDGGAIIHCEEKPGYYDGAYHYINEEGKYVISTEGYKIDIYTESVDDVIWECNGDLEKIKERFILDYHHSYSGPTLKSKINDFWDSVEKKSIKAREYHKSSLAEFSERIKKSIAEGFCYIQLKDNLDKTWMTDFKRTKNITAALEVAKSNKEKGNGLINEGVMGGEFDALLYSGNFVKIDKGEYFDWVLK